MPAMQGRARFNWQADHRRIHLSPTARWRPAGPTPAPSQPLPHNPARRRPVPAQRLAPRQAKDLLDGFCPEPSQEEQIAVQANGLMLSVRLADVEWLEAAGHCVKLHVGKQTHRLRDPLAVVAAKLPPGRFLRISRSTLVNREQIQGLQRLFFDEYEVLLRNGTRLPLPRAYYSNLLQLGFSLPIPTSLIPSSRLILGKTAGN